jgi:PepSY-associated TM region
MDNHDGRAPVARTDEATLERPREEATTGDGSRQWRSMWRLHFYAGMFAMPFIVLMAITGLAILYIQPLHNLTQGRLRSVTPAATLASFDAQEKAVEQAFPKGTVISLTPPASSSGSTMFGLDDGTTDGRSVFVNPYTAEVLGSIRPGGDLIGLANRLQGYLNNSNVKIYLPRRLDPRPGDVRHLPLVATTIEDVGGSQRKPCVQRSMVEGRPSTLARCAWSLRCPAPRRDDAHDLLGPCLELLLGAELHGCRQRDHAEHVDGRAAERARHPRRPRSPRQSDPVEHRRPADPGELRHTGRRWATGPDHPRWRGVDRDH